MESIATQCHDLRILNLSYCRGISKFSTWLDKLSRLRSFHVAANDVITDFDVRILAEQNATTLCSFHAPACPQVTGKSLLALAEFCTNLVDVNVGQCDAVANREVETLFNSCPKLENIDLRSTQTTDALFESIFEFSDVSKVLKRLQVLDISYCHGVTETGVSALSQFLAKGRRKEPVAAYVHQTRVSRKILEHIDCNSIRIRF